MRTALILLAMTAGTATPDPIIAADAKFSVGGIALRLPVPAGYCVPTPGVGEAAAQLLAAGDSDNVTHLQFDRCGEKSKGTADDYIIIKTPKSALLAKLDRADLLVSLGNEFENPLFLSKLELPKVGESLSEVFGSKVMLAGTIKPLGRDAMCAYLGGAIDVKMKEVSYTQPVGACITSTAGRLFIAYRYGKDNSPEGIAALLLEAKTIAETVQSN